MQTNLLESQSYSVQYNNDENKFLLFGALMFQNVEKYNELLHFIYNNAIKINNIINGVL